MLFDSCNFASDETNSYNKKITTMKKTIILLIILSLLQGVAYAQYENYSMYSANNYPVKTTLRKDTSYYEFNYRIKSFPKWAEELCNKEQRQYLDSLFTLSSSVDCSGLVLCLTHPSMIDEIVQTTRRFFPLSYYAGKDVQLVSLIHEISPVKKKKCNYNQYVIYKGFLNPEVKILLNVYFTTDENNSIEISHYDVVVEGPEGTYPKLKKGKYPFESFNRLKLYRDGSFGGTILQTLTYNNEKGTGIKENICFNFITNLLEQISE